MPIANIINRDGVITTSFQCAITEGPTDNGNGDESLTITCDLDRLAVSNYTPGVSELYVTWEDESFWGRATWAEPDLSTGKLAIHCVGLFDYFNHRHFGEARPDVFGSNMSFETAGLNATGWFADAAPVDTVTMTRVASQFSGSWCAQLVNSDDNNIGYMYQAATALPTINANIFLAAWLKCDPIFPVASNGAPVMTMQCKDIGGTVLGSVESTTTFSPTTPTNEWFRVETPGLYLPSATHSIEWFLFASGGTVQWDEVRLTTDPMLKWNSIDVATIVRQIAQYAQGMDVGVAAQPYWPTIKDHLNISTSISATGRERFRVIHLYERGNVGAELREWTERDDGIEMWMTHNQGAGTRTLNIADRRGTDLSATVSLRAGSDVTHVDGPNCEAVGRALVDGRKTTNAAVVTYAGSGPTREFGYANDGRPVTQLGSELPPEESAETPDLTTPTLETVISAPQDTPLDGVMNAALAHRKAHASPVYLPELRCAYDDFKAVKVGDRVDLEIREGWFVYAGDVRIGSRSVDVEHRQITFSVTPITTRGRRAQPTIPAAIERLRERVFEVERTRLPPP